MTELSTNEPEFDIMLTLDGVDEHITVIPQETSDGANYYNCKAKGQQLTQIRETTTGEWEQIWGELSPSKVNLIGKTIKAQL